MLVYNYDYNGVFLSATEADESPLERGVFLIPANATKIEPPVEVFGKVRVFHEGKWANVDVSEQGQPYLPQDEPKSPEEIKAALTAAVQRHLDATANAFGYDNILSAVTYADESVVQKFQEDGMKFRAWRSLVWGMCYHIMDQVERREREIPSVEQLISELPLLDMDTSVWLPNPETGLPEVVAGKTVEVVPVWDEATSTWITPAAPEPVVVPVVEVVEPVKSNAVLDVTKMIWDTLTKTWKEPAPIPEPEPYVIAPPPPLPEVK